VRIVWSRRAVQHLEEIRSYIAQDHPQAARGVAAKILEGVDLLAGHPHIGRAGRVVGTRELVVSGTPYVIPYRVKADRLELIAVFHGKQRWPRRL
jgi:addiction module RelE/StbE family toxin